MTFDELKECYQEEANKMASDKHGMELRKLPKAEQVELLDKAMEMVLDRRLHVLLAGGNSNA